MNLDVTFAVAPPEAVVWSGVHLYATGAERQIGTAVR